MIDDRWLDSALDAQARNLPAPTEREVATLWAGMHGHRTRRRGTGWHRLGIGIAAVLLLGVGWIGLVPLGLPSFGILDHWRAERWQSRVLDPRVTVGDRSATLSDLTSHTPGTALADLQRLFAREEEPGLRGAILQAAARLHPADATPWVWSAITDSSNAEVTRMQGLGAVGDRMAVDSLVALVARVPLSIRYSIFEQLRDHPDSAATQALATLAHAAKESAEREAILAALERRPASQLHDLLRTLTR